MARIVATEIVIIFSLNYFPFLIQICTTGWEMDGVGAHISQEGGSKVRILDRFFSLATVFSITDSLFGRLEIEN